MEDLQKVLATLNEQQKEAFLDFAGAARDPQLKTIKLEKLKALLTNDQWFLIQKAFIKEGSGKAAQNSDVDPSAYTCMHFWLGGCGFGSEVNNLISASVYCREHGLELFVEDENWNSGRLHDYLQAEPLIRKPCPPGEGKSRPLEVKRDRRQATVGWFAVCKHAREVPFEVKAALAKQIWRYTPDADRRIRTLNAELELPASYLAVQIRRRDKIAGKVSIADYVKAALENFLPPMTAIVICTDDITAAEEFGAEIGREHPEIDVRWRKRKDAPEKLLQGHQQPDYNALPLEDREALTHEFLADVELMRKAKFLVCTYSSNVGRLVALIREGLTLSLDDKWTNT